MLYRLRTRLSYANVTASVALFVSLGGTSYAALRVTGENVKNSSLTGADIKNSSLSHEDLKDSSLGTADIRDGSLLAKDFKPGELTAGAAGPRGERGDDGPPGERGPAGAAGLTNVTVRVRTEYINDGGAGSQRDILSPCAAGERATGGGAEAISDPDPGTGERYRFSVLSRPSPVANTATPTGWEAHAAIGAGNPGGFTYSVYAICAS